MLNVNNLPPLEDELEAACYRVILKLIVPDLRAKFKDFKFNWPVETKRGCRDWTTCLIQNKGNKRHLAVIFGTSQSLVFATRHGHLDIPLADPDIHIKILKYVSLALEVACT